MSARDAAPAENIKPRRGMLVILTGDPGVWQCLDQAPGTPGSWWLTPWDHEARAARPDGQWGAYRKATYRDMKTANGQ